MQVSFYATLRYIVGEKTVDFPHQEGITLREFVEEIVERYPGLRPELLDSDGQLMSHVHVIVNGRDAPFLVDGIEARLSPGDKISIFPAVGGGFI
jgi:molybdopterin synthase sulfur carrier subunit